jgi:hypothetical protein
MVPSGSEPSGGIIAPLSLAPSPAASCECAVVDGAQWRRERHGAAHVSFVGDVASGKSLVGLYSLVATCESRGINPFDYLADVLARVQDHPANALDELLPGAWAAAN